MIWTRRIWVQKVCSIKNEVAKALIIRNTQLKLGGKIAQSLFISISTN